MKNNWKLFIGMLVIGVAVISSTLVGLIYSSQFVMAQVNNTTASPTVETANRAEKQQQVNITGSIPLQSIISQALRSEIQVPMAEAITTAQNTAGENSSVVAAFLSPLKGFLVYNIGVMGANNTIYKVIVDPGNGEVLFTSEGRQLDSFHQLMSGPFENKKGYNSGGHEKGGFGHEFGSSEGPFGHWKGHGGGYGLGGGGFWHNR
jgi:uncharacterized membrane protein YkoI